MTLRDVSKRQRGFSLIELMVALVLGLLLMGAVLQFYLANKASFISQDQNGYLQESGRYAVGDISRMARMAGLSGCSSRPIPGKPIPLINHLRPAADYAYALFTGVRGFESNTTAPTDAIYSLGATNPAVATSATDWTPALPSTGANPLLGKVVPGSDVLVVTLTGAPARLVDPFTDAASFKAEPSADLQNYDIAVVTNCQQAEIFQITNLTTTSGRINVVGAASSVVPGNSGPISNTGPTRDFRAGSEISALRSYVYYVGVGADGGPALFRARLRTNPSNDNKLEPEELVSGVESMQLTYGVDTDDNFVVDQYVPAAAGTDWQRVRAVRVALLMRSPEEFLPTPDTTAFYQVAGTRIKPVEDRRQRRVFETTVALRNRLL
jgi:type IV pilus assembly protein PilW